MNVPQLRFSGFDGEWENFELKKLVKLEGGATPLKSEKRYWQNGHIPWVSSQEVGPKKLDKTTFNITEAAVSETSTKMVEKDTLLLVVRSGILVRKIPLSITAVPMAINQDIKAMIIKDKKLHHLFLYQWMKKNEKAMLSNVVKGGTTVQSVNTPDLQDYLIGIPSIDEQYKIAEFFELVDKKIEKLQEKIENLKRFKKGMMQKIFSQELRFKDENGGEFPEWEEKKLDKCLEIENGFPFKSSYFTTEPLGMPLLRIRDIKAEKLNTYYTGSFDEKYLVDNEDIVIGMDGEFAVSKWKKGPALLNQRVMRIKSKEDNSLSYLYQLLKIVVQKIEDITPQTTVKHLSNKDIFNSIVKIPIFDEQQKIGTFFLDIDTKIEKEKEKLMVLEEQKKGFMWRIFV